MRKTAFTLAAAVVLLAAGAGCSKTPAKVMVIPAKANLIGKEASVTLKANVMDAKGQTLPEVPVAWRSSNEAVATVDPGGKVTPKASGDVVFTATAGKVSGEAKVTVIVVASIQASLAEPGLVGPAGTKVAMAVKVLDDKNREIPNPALTFESSAPACATVDKAGLVTLVGSGPVTLKASLGKVQGTIQGDVLLQVPKFLKLSKSAMVLKKGDTAPLEFEVFDEKGKPCKIPPAFTSSDGAVVTVDARGIVTAVGPGSAEITLTVGQDKRPVKVTVH